MARMQFATTSYERAAGDLPELPVINMVAEVAPTEATGIALISRPGLADRAADMGTDIEALFDRDGVLSGNLFGVSGGYLFQGTTNLGAIPGSGAVSMAGNEIGLLVAAGSTLRYWNGTTLADVAFPDSASVAKVASGGSRFWMIRADTGKLYFTPALAATVAALDFITAESLPDKLLDILWLDDSAILFGAESVEFWPNTGDAALPIQPLEGRVFEKGIRATGCAAVFDGSFAWVGNDNVVYVNGQGPTPISNPGLEARIAASTTCRLFTFQLDGQEFLCLRLDAETQVFGARNKLWSEMASYGATNWLPKCHAGGVFGCSNGKTATWADGYTDFGGVTERLFRAGFPLNSGGQTVDNIILRTNVGQTPYLTGDYTEPTVELRLSRDGGRTWGSWRQKSLGAQGNYRTAVRWLALGMASQPGLLVELRVSDPIGWRVSDVLTNEAFGGR